MNIAFILDPLEAVDIRKDSSFAMMREAAKRGHDLHVLHQEDIILSEGSVRAASRKILLTGSEPVWYRLGEARPTALADFDAVLMRKDPPFDMEYFYSTHLLELAEREGARIFNGPDALRNWNEKLAILRFPELIPPTLVSRSEEAIRGFLDAHKDIIVKPLDGMGGAGVFRMRENDPNIGVIVETITLYGKRTVMAQRFIPEIEKGDKRILVVGGVAAPYCLARIPKPGETRGNLASGGKGVAQPLSVRDLEIAALVGPALEAEGIVLAGLDVIGDCLTEINVTSPTCMQEIMAQTGFDVAKMVIDLLEVRCACSP
ncbi:MAG: glutathione synthase [Burkholderiales bacterium]|nr:glutathione synthase [Burkholderiales bacterium]